MLVDFVIITALEEEQDALITKLPPVQRLPPSDDDVHVYYRTELPVTLSDGTTGTYTLILLSIMGMTREKAAIFTGDALHRWHPRYILLVGIAGGIAAAQVARGDVLISEQIVDYEPQKITAQGEREHRWEVHRGDPRLLEASRHLGDGWRLLIRKRRPQPGKPATFFGPIATGDKVVDYLPFLGDLLRDWPKLIGVEMESGGVANAAFQAAKAAGFFMIRGVSDLAENKDDTWRQYACHTAAAYTLALLQSGPIPLNAPLGEEISTPLVGSTSLSGNGAPSRELIGEESQSPRRGWRISRRKLLAVAGGVVTIGGIGGITWRWILSPHPLYTYRGHSGSVYSVAWSPDSKRIASASADMTVQVWDAADGSNVFTYRGHVDFVEKVAWSPDGRRIVSGSGGKAGNSDNTVRVWDAVDGSHVYTYREYTRVVQAVSWSPDGRRIASTDGDKTVQVWDEATGGNVFTYHGHSGGVYAVVWSPSIDSLHIASGGNDTTVQIWDAVDGSHVYTYRGNSEYVRAVAWSPNGKRIASGGSVVQVWDAVDGSHVYTYRGHAEETYSITWSLDGRHIASAGGDKTVQIWDAENGDHINTYNSYTHEVAWSPDGQRIAFANDDGTVQVWQAM